MSSSDAWQRSTFLLTGPQIFACFLVVRHSKTWSVSPRIPEQLRDVSRSCSKDHCKMELAGRPAASCHEHCQSQGLHCLRAWQKGQRSCEEEELLPCDHHRGGDKICECVPLVRPDLCFRKGLTFRPLNMKDQGRSHEPDALSCQRRCAKVFGCAHFSFWTDGGCHLQDDGAELAGSDGVTSGPASCLTQPARHRRSEACITEGVSCWASSGVVQCALSGLVHPFCKPV